MATASSRLRGARRSLVLAILALVLGACELRTQLNITVEEGGFGQVELAVGLDEEAVSRWPELVEGLDFADLQESGWEVVGPAEEADGFTWIRARHAFGTPEELALLVEEIAGDDGPFQDFALERDDEFAETVYRFRGIVDFTSGLDSITEDPELAEALGAEPRELIEDRVGAAIDEVVNVQVAVRLPGEVDSNAPTRASNGAVWTPSVVEPEPVPLVATGTVSRTERWVWLGVAAAAGFALLLFLLVQVVLWRRRRAASTVSSAGPGSS